MYIANSAKTVTCAVYALVLATEISGPAWVKIVRSHSLEMLDPITFTTPKVRIRLDLQSLQRGKGIRSFAGLAYEDGQRLGRQHRIAISKLAGVVHIRGQAEQLFKEVLPH